MKTPEQRHPVHIETSNLFCSAKQLTGFCMKHNTGWRRSGVFIVNFGYIFTCCSSVSTVSFEHVIAGRVNYFQKQSPS